MTQLKRLEQQIYLFNMAHEFYIVNTDDSNYEDILQLSTNFIFGKPRCSLDETKAVIQIRDGQEPTPILDPYPVLSRDEAVSIMQTDEWQNNSI